MECPSPDDLAAFGKGRLRDESREQMEAHIDACDTCCRVASELARVFHDADIPDDERPEEDEAGVTIQDGRSGDEVVEAGDRDLLPPGSRLDRYHILEQVGEGAMGVVYAAYDPDLDRKVALKVLRSSKKRSEERSLVRLLREAQAMARLSHPNVIPVHEARVVDGRLFISMEFVEGQTLKEWLANDKPDWKRILELFRDVARAIAAAHGAGLIHRDVKPDNILVGKDGRVRVTDFGLARPTTADSLEIAETSPRSDSPSNPRRGALATSLTRHGALVGTPAYMAPEQLTGRVAIEASDQFSVCVALYEALFGLRPYAGQSLAQLSRNVLEGRIREPERDRGVPRWLRQVVLRGLSTNPHDRFPDMAALVSELEREPERTRKRWIFGSVAAGFLVGAGSLAGLGMSAASPRCESGDDGAASLWSGETRERIITVLSDPALPYAEDTTQHVSERLDTYTEDWEHMYEDACLAHARGQQSDVFFDLRMACLHERRRELEALLQILSYADGEVVRNAVDTVDGLRGLEPCADLEALSARVPPPTDPVVVRDVARIEGDLARVRVLSRAGRYDAASTLAQTATNAARTSSYDPILAESLLLQAEVERTMLSFEDAGAHAQEAWQVALQAGDDQLAAESSILLVEILGFGLRRYEEAKARAGDASAMIARIERQDPDAARGMESDLYFTRGQNELRAKQAATAARLFQQALEIHVDHTGSETLHTANILNALGTATQAQYDYATALDYYRQALQIRQRFLGDHHPQIAGLRNNIGLMLKHLDRMEEAYESLIRAYETFRAGVGRDHGLTLMAALNLAEVCYLMERPAEAVRYYEDVFPIEVIAEISEPTDYDRIGHYGTALTQIGRPDEALRIWRTVIGLARERGDRRVLRHQLRYSLPTEVQEASAQSLDEVVALAEELIELEDDGRPNHDTHVAEAQLLLARALERRNAAGDERRAREMEKTAMAVLRTAGVNADASKK